MASSHTASDVRQRHLDELGPELGALFDALYHDLMELRVKWQQYVALFGKSQERVDLLNRAASTFFRIIQTVLWHDLLMHLCRVTDPEKTAGKSNATIRRLPALVEPQAFQLDLNRLVEDAVTSTEFARDWRNRRIAHWDFDVALDPSAAPLAPASRQSVLSALDAIAAILGSIYLQYFDSTLVTDEVITSSDADWLVAVLNEGLYAQDERSRLLKEGKLRPEDYRRPDAV